MTVEEWVPRLAAELGLDAEVDVDAILAAAGEAAHTVERKAAPVTTFMIGLAAGRAGGAPQDVADALRAARAALAGL